MFMRIFEKLYLTVQNLLSFLTGGTDCICCGMQTYAVPLCKECRKKFFEYVQFEDEKRCRICGKELVSEKLLCTECVKGERKRVLDGLYPVHMYRLWKKDLLYEWKSKDQRSLSPVFASLAAKAVNELLSKNKIKFEAIVPVPPRPGKIRSKGWDQVDELCRILEKKHGFTVKRLLERLSSVEQKSLNKNERKGGKGAKYSLKKGIFVNGSNFLIIDDVITTGSTLEKCAVLLKKAGAGEVYGLSLFMVD